jgi:hypothetical protein
MVGNFVNWKETVEAYFKALLGLCLGLKKTRKLQSALISTDLNQIWYMCGSMATGETARW